jgi:hypothetical protein
MKLFLEKNLLVSYAIHINSYQDLKLIENSLLIISKKCKIIGITYSINSDVIDENKIKDIFLLLQKDIINLKVYGQIKNEGYDFRKHLHTIKKFKEEKLYKEYILMMNDSVIPISSSRFNKTMFNLLSFMNEGYEFIGLLVSNEIKKHYQSWFWCCDKSTMNWILMQIEKIVYSENKTEFVIKLEVGLSNYLIRNKRCIGLYNFNIKKNLFYHHSNVYIKALHNGFPFLKKNYFIKEFRKKYRLKLHKEILNYLPENII